MQSQMGAVKQDHLGIPFNPNYFTVLLSISGGNEAPTSIIYFNLFTDLFYYNVNYTWYLSSASAI